MTAPDVADREVGPAAPAGLSRRTLLLVALLMPVGPASVALLRYLLPYFAASGGADVAAAVAAEPGRQSAVLWLGYLAVLTLVPGVLAAAQVTRGRSPRLTTAALCLLVPAYLSMGTLLAGDSLLWAGTSLGLDSSTVAALYDEVHPSAMLGIVVFVVGHIVGTVLLGIALLRSREVPPAAAWALTVSQPLHFLAGVVLGSRELDLLAWSLTAVGMAYAGRALVRMPR